MMNMPTGPARDGRLTAREPTAHAGLPGRVPAPLFNEAAVAPYLDEALAALAGDVSRPEMRGRVLEAVGTLIKAIGVSARVGDVCELVNPGRTWRMAAEVVGVMREVVLLAPYGELTGISTQTQIIHRGEQPRVRVGPQLPGRILDGFGELLDGGQALPADCLAYPVQAHAPKALGRPQVTELLQTGVRAIDAMLSCGVGQRMGIFSPAGGGKSSLLGMLARGSDADVIVLALVGERGREVEEILAVLRERGLMTRAVCVVATSDRPAAERARAPCVAMAIAEYFRDEGKSVLLLMDSVTRYARALREIGLAAGEPPTRRGFPPSVFAALPRLFERAGRTTRGSITAFFTVLVDDDVLNDPIAEEVRATLDGHIVLSAKLADANHFPAIDVLVSRSRVMRHVVNEQHARLAGTARELLASYQSVEMLHHMGEYRQGADEVADRAIRIHAQLQAFLEQAVDEVTPVFECVNRLAGIVA
ncbi:MAG TPA: FliI/YscN family ATPase [Rhodocyclaceae bacterium]|nr:FliI/YscN family ATPase [Rhodocyclaceae bacterium]